MKRRIQKRRRWRDFRGILQPVGAVLSGIAVAQVICALVGWLFLLWEAADVSAQVDDVFALLGAAALTASVGVTALVYGRQFASEGLSRREAILSVVIIWIAAGVFGGVPFVFGANMSPIDALFEAVSGLTTTGATVINAIEGTPPGALEDANIEVIAPLSIPILLWRSLIQWLGGMGIVVLFVAVFPTVGAGAKHLFKGEVPGTTAEGLKPRIAATSFTLWRLYAALTVVEVVLLLACGMTGFEALCHSFTTLSTGGFSTRDASIAAFHSPAIEYVVATFMLLGSVNYGLYYALLRGSSLRAVLRNTELRAFIAIVTGTTIVLTLGTQANHNDNLLDSFRASYFMVGTTISSTGFGIDDYMAYSDPMLFFIILMMFIGGCSGSTAGGIKVERIVLMGKMAWAEFRQSFRPAVVQVIRMGRSAVGRPILLDVAVFVGVYTACLAFGVLFISASEGISLPAAFGATLTCLSNMGPAPFHPGADNFTAYSDTAKLFFVLAMLLGRLEFFTMFALLIPGFWRR